MALVVIYTTNSTRSQVAKWWAREPLREAESWGDANGQGRRRTYLAVPVLHPLPTTKSPAPEKVTEYPLELGEKLTLPPVL